ncbi:MAG: 16S rRNA (uracil(1498)-N(3))-methyltransferase [Proteobacteria bacterium]|nr:16S rRNA (uracil(1498)-N(3))-methyltransferase [Pseudomonadota bacterium]
MRRFWIQPGEADSGRVRFQPAEARHARDVLRLKSGDPVLLIDGTGTEYSARISSIDRSGVEAEIIETRSGLPEPTVDLTLALALLRPDNMDLVVQKSVELGLKTLIPMQTGRTAAHLASGSALRRLERWRRIAAQALKQCRRSVPVQIEAVHDFDQALKAASRADTRLMFHPPPGLPDRRAWSELLGAAPPRPSVFIMIGPEGGFTDEETDRALEKGFHLVGLGPRILRSETAALAAVTILGFELGDLF